MAVDTSWVKEKLKKQHIETPSWGYGDGGTRFKVFPWPGAAKTIFHKIDDAAFIHKLTGIAPTVALHIPWDMPPGGSTPDEWAKIAAYAEEKGIGLGAINSNTFQDNVYRFGSVASPDPEARKKAVEHMIECTDIMRATGSDILSVWLADGTNYPGQDSLRGRKHRLYDGLAEVYAHMPEGSRMLVEYKFFEPYFYSTDLQNWGMSLLMCEKLGDQAQVLVDTGHHPQGTNVEQIVAILLDEARLGGFHFNDRKYADDDLIVGTINPFTIFLIYNELVDAEFADDAAVKGCAQDVAYMIDQSHNIEPKLEAMLQSVINCQIAYAKALMVDRDELNARREAMDVLGAFRVLQSAFHADVSDLLVEIRREMGVPEDPFAAYAESDYPQKVADERGLADGSQGGYPG